MPRWDAGTQAWEWTDAELEAEIEAGARRTAELRKQHPMLTVTGAMYLPGDRRVRVDFDNCTTFIFPVDRVQFISGATDDQLAKLEIWGHDTIAWPELDAHVPMSSLLAGIFGSSAWMSALQRERGKKGGESRTAAKAAAARQNGKKGGRPRKAAP